MARGLFISDDRSSCRHESIEELRLDGLKIGVSTGSIHDGVEIGMQRHRPVSGSDAKIRSFGSAVDGYVIERAGIFSCRGEIPANAFDRAQIGVAEGVCAANRRVARAVGLPRTEASIRVNSSHWLGIDQIGLKMHGLVGPDT